MPLAKHPPGDHPGGAQPTPSKGPGDQRSRQLTLEDHYTRLSDPPTSREAAAALDPGRVRRQVTDVVLSVASHPGGAICHEVTADLDRDRGCIARRLTDACRSGFVRPAGYRIAPSGRRQIVWAATSSGLALAARQMAETAHRGRGAT